MKVFSYALVAIGFSLCVAGTPLNAQLRESGKNSAVVPVPRDAGWMKRHESFNDRAKQGDVDLVFIGDSITQGWEGAGKKAWEKHYGNRKAMNLGISGDRTQHVLWRLDNGNIEGIKPKLAVIMIGTNNSIDNTAEEIADGIKGIVAKLRDKLPETKLLILAVFPRGAMSEAQLEKVAGKKGKAKTDDAELATKIAAEREKTIMQRKKLTAVNQSVSKLADNRSIFYLDIGPKYLQADGTLPDEVMPDYLHLSPKGYEIWAEAIEPKVKELLGEPADGKTDGRKAQNDSQKIQGTWTAVSYIADGESVDPKEAPVRWGFTDNMVTFFADVDEASANGKFKLNADQSPHSIDLVFGPGPGENMPQTLLGIYSLVGDQLKVCYGADGAKRPREFKSKTGSNLIEIVFEKVVK